MHGRSLRPLERRELPPSSVFSCILCDGFVRGIPHRIKETQQGNVFPQSSLAVLELSEQPLLLEVLDLLLC